MENSVQEKKEGLVMTSKAKAKSSLASLGWILLVLVALVFLISFMLFKRVSQAPVSGGELNERYAAMTATVRTMLSFVVPVLFAIGLFQVVLQYRSGKKGK